MLIFDGTRLFDTTRDECDIVHDALTEIQMGNTVIMIVKTLFKRNDLIKLKKTKIMDDPYKHKTSHIMYDMFSQYTLASFLETSVADRDTDFYITVHPNGDTVVKRKDIDFIGPKWIQKVDRKSVKN